MLVNALLGRHRVRKSEKVLFWPGELGRPSVDCQHRPLQAGNAGVIFLTALTALLHTNTSHMFTKFNWRSYTQHSMKTLDTLYGY